MSTKEQRKISFTSNREYSWDPQTNTSKQVPVLGRSFMATTIYVKIQDDKEFANFLSLCLS